MRLHALLLILLFTSCLSPKPLSPDNDISYGKDLPKALNAFLLEFEKAVLSHKKTSLFDFIDVTYKDEQLGNLGDNVSQFVDELFYGISDMNGVFTGIPFEEIEHISLLELKEIEDNLFQAVYLVSSKDQKIKVDWEITKSSKNSRSGYGFVGAYG